MPWELIGDFLGTTDNRPLVIQTSGLEQARIETNGYFGLGTTTPGARLTVASGGAIIAGVTLGIDVPGIDYPFAYETIGVSDINLNLRLQSPNAIIFHTGNPPTQKLLIEAGGRVTVGAGAVIRGVSIGVDVPGINYPFEYETIGVADSNFNLRLQSPNAIIFHTGNPPTQKLLIDAGGRVTVGAGAVIRGVSIGVDVPGINYPFEYETIGVADSNFNLRLQSPNAIIFHTGNPPTEKVVVTSDGDIQLVGADCAERVAVTAGHEIEPGVVLVIGERGQLEPCRKPYDTRVAGVVSGANGIKSGIVLGKGKGDASVPVALVGTVFCKVDASEGAVDVGDLLTTSPREGYAMRADERALMPGALLGKSLGRLASGQDMIPVLVALQ